MLQPSNSKHYNPQLRIITHKKHSQKDDFLKQRHDIEISKKIKFKDLDKPL